MIQIKIIVILELKVRAKANRGESIRKIVAPSNSSMIWIFVESTVGGRQIIDTLLKLLNQHNFVLTSV